MVSGAVVKNDLTASRSRRMPRNLGYAATAIVFFYDMITYSKIAYFTTTEATIPILTLVFNIKFYLFYLSEVAFEIMSHFIGRAFPDFYDHGQFDFITFFAVGATNGALSYDIALKILCDLVFGFLQWFLIGKLILWVRERPAKS
jgi:hypothetical protein